MNDSQRDGWQTRGTPIAHLEHVPISAEYFAVVKRVLGAHGAVLVETGDMLPVGVEGNARIYQVQFPHGTMRINGLVMHRSVPFELVFPDGYHLHGTELWPITQRENDHCLNGLMLAPEDLHEEKE